MREVGIQTEEPVYTRKSTERIVKITDIKYAKTYLKQVIVNATHTNDDERTQPLGLLNEFDDLFGGTLGEWDTKPVDIDLNIYSKHFNCKNYLVHRINNETFHKDLQCLV